MKNPLTKVFVQFKRLRRFLAHFSGMAIYNVTFEKQQPIKVLLAKSIAHTVMTHRTDHQGAVQYVWLQARHEVEIDPLTYANVKVPQLHVWRNVDRQGNYVVGLQLHRDATARERKMAGSLNR